MLTWENYVLLLLHTLIYSILFQNDTFQAHIFDAGHKYHVEHYMMMNLDWETSLSLTAFWKSLQKPEEQE